VKLCHSRESLADAGHLMCHSWGKTCGPASFRGVLAWVLLHCTFPAQTPFLIHCVNNLSPHSVSQPCLYSLCHRPVPMQPTGCRSNWKTPKPFLTVLIGPTGSTGQEGSRTDCVNTLSRSQSRV
jgi:hypothetical protein